MTFKEKLHTLICMLYPILKKILFTLPPESAHDLTIKIASLSPELGRVLGTKINPDHAVSLGSLEWKFPLGLAAGLDKNAEALNFFAAQGFGAIECGTITLKAQSGNERPRMWRYPDEKSLRNAMGFPNQGLDVISSRIKRFEHSAPLGANIGKNKESSKDESIRELSQIVSTLNSYTDYFVVNVSSPNTPGLRAFQERSYLLELFDELKKFHKNKDLYLKIAPDLEKEKIIELTQTALDCGLTGIIATNTTIEATRGPGGMSGMFLHDRARTVRSIILSEQTNLELIGVGGVNSFDDLLEFWSEGGKVMQAFTSYIYQGPDLLSHFSRGITHFLKFTEQKSLQSFLSLSLAEKKRIIADFRKKESNQRNQFV